jgi:hypothetical protein
VGRALGASAWVGVPPWSRRGGLLVDQSGEPLHPPDLARQPTSADARVRVRVLPPAALLWSLGRARRPDPDGRACGVDLPGLPRAGLLRHCYLDGYTMTRIRVPQARVERATFRLGGERWYTQSVLVTLNQA